MKMEPTKILHVLNSLETGGGVQKIVLDIYNNIDRSLVQFDFLVTGANRAENIDQITKLGARVFYQQNLSAVGLPAFFCGIYEIIKENGPYYAVHAHTGNQSALAALAALLCGIKIRVAHAHNAINPKYETLLRRAYSETMRALIKLSVNRFAACGVDAGINLFGKPLHNKGRISVINNAIDLNVFIKSDAQKSKELRRSLGISDNTLVLGNIARFTVQKNHNFFIALLKSFRDSNIKVKLLLAGDGELKEDFEKKIICEGLSDDVVFLGVRKDIPVILKALDVFVLPSLFEGLPITLMEAQACATPSVVSDEVTKEADLDLGLISYLSLKDDLKIWQSRILEKSRFQKPSSNELMYRFRKRGYDFSSSISKLEDIYGVKLCK